MEALWADLELVGGKMDSKSFEIGVTVGKGHLDTVRESQEDGNHGGRMLDHSALSRKRAINFWRGFHAHPH